MRETNLGESSKNDALHQRRQGSAGVGFTSDVSGSSNDHTASMDEPSPSLGISRLSDDYANCVYSKHAEEFPEKFRASIDYSIREKPLQVLIGIAVLVVLVLLACGPSWTGEGDGGGRFFEQPFADLDERRQAELRFYAHQILGCLMVAIAGYCFLESRDGLLVRPHPGVWRLIHGVSFAYFLFFVVLLALNRDDGRNLIRLILPGFEAKKNVFSGTLVLDCSISTHAIKRQLTSIWFVSHLTGWFLKMCIFRSWMFTLTFSILFEFCEMSLQWAIPEFQECWWDSVFIDAIISNLMGMLVGCAVMRWFGKRHFDWLGAYPTYQKILLKFTPFSSCNYEWSFFRTPRHLLMTSLLLFLSLLAEVNVFLLMTSLDIPAPHWINVARIVLLGLLAFPAVAEFYAQVHFKYDRMGGNVFLFFMILLVELLVTIKYGADRFLALSPGADVLLPWALTAGLFGIWCKSYFSKATQEQEMQELSREEVGKPQKRNFKDAAVAMLLRIPPQACFLPLLYLTKNYLYGAH